MGHRARQMVWQLLEFSLQYLQIKVLSKHEHLQTLQGQSGRARTWPSEDPTIQLFQPGCVIWVRTITATCDLRAMEIKSINVWTPD